MEVIQGKSIFGGYCDRTDLLFYKRTETGKAYKSNRQGCRGGDQTLRRCVRDGKRTVGRAL